MSTKPDTGPISALISLGGNIGNVIASMQFAIDELHGHECCSVLAVSHVYRTPPWGVTDQSWFFNACAEINTDLEPEALLDFLLSIEVAKGRVRETRWGPRTLDLDIIAYGNIHIKSERLSVPHPRMHERAFVIVPLLDICPDRMIAGKQVKEYATGLDRGGIMQSDDQLKF